MRKLYSAAVIQNVPRLLGLMDRNRFSATYGCFDRQFWHYKVVDFPAARLQEAALTLALLYKNKYPRNIYHRQESMRQWAAAAMLFWAKSQSGNGSFSEWYPNENSFVATSLSTYAISEAFLLLKDELDGEAKEKIKAALVKAFDWLSKNSDFTASSQQGGALCSLYNGYLITRNEKYRQAYEKRLEKQYENRSEEGWLPK